MARDALGHLGDVEEAALPHPVIKVGKAQLGPIRLAVQPRVIRQADDARVLEPEGLDVTAHVLKPIGG